MRARRCSAEDERVAAEVRRQYKWFVVDEFQDVSPIQSALLDLWLGGRDEICVVGDPAQTIYSFAGAQAAYLTDFADASSRGTTAVELVRNYRSTPQVVEAANTLLDGATTAQRPAARPARAGSGGDAGTRRTDEVAEAEAVADEVDRLRETGTPLREMAVLFRINAQSEAFEEALTARGIPYVVRGAARFFERPGGAAGGGPDARRGARAARRGQDDDERPATSWAGSPPCSPAWAGRPRRPTARGQARDRWESLQALVSQADGLRRRRRAGDGPTLAGFVAELDRRAHEQHAPVAEGVTLATLHAAKGLEWDAVFLCGMQDGSMPITYAEGPAAIEEERRLLYVGITRARSAPLGLVVAGPQPRRARRGASRRASWPACARVGHRPRRGRPRARSRRRRSKKAAVCKQCQRPLASSRERNRGYCADCPVPYDEELFERLRDLAQGAGRRGERAGVRRVLRRHPRGARRGAADRPRRRCARSTGSGRPSWRGTPTSCSRLVGLTDSRLLRTAAKSFAASFATGVPCSLTAPAGPGQVSPKRRCDVTDQHPE